MSNAKLIVGTLKALRLCAACGLVLLMSGCASLTAPQQTVVELGWKEPMAITEPIAAQKPRLAVVLSSGSLRGYAHIGVLRAFEKAGIRPDIIVGSSVGAMVGSLWAAGAQAAEIEGFADELRMNVLSDWAATVWRITQGNIKGLVSGDELENFIARHISVKNIEDLPIRFAVVAADLQSGEAIRINMGSLAKAVRVSSGIPVLMAPCLVSVNGKLRELIDGGLVEPLPVRTARRLGADIVVAIDVGYRPSEAQVWNPIGVSFQSLQISINALRAEQALDADIVVAPKIHESDVLAADFQRLIAEGERAMTESISTLKIKLASKKAGK